MSQLPHHVEPNIEQLARALDGVLDPNSRLRRYSKPLTMACFRIYSAQCVEICWSQHHWRSAVLTSRPCLRIFTGSQILSIEQGLPESSQVDRAMRSPVNKLPPEVLSIVLQNRDRVHDLIVATHVCQHWRYALISDPCLWTSLQLRSTADIDRALTYLERSKSVAINVSMDWDSEPPLGFLQRLVPHIPRIGSLTIRGPFGIDAVPSVFLCSPVPSLESLEIEAFRGCVRAFNNFLGRHAPSLREATFHGIFPMINFPFPPPGLIRLNLDLVDITHPIHMSSLLRLYSSCPQLQEAYIGNRCQIIQDVTSDQIILMPSLVKLKYWARNTTATRFLLSLKLPRLKKLSVTSPWEPGTVDKLSDLLPHGGDVLLAGATSILYNAEYGGPHKLQFSWKGVNASRVTFRMTGKRPAKWPYDQTYTPFEQIESLTLGGSNAYLGFPINLFKNITTLRVTSSQGYFSHDIFQSLHPLPGSGVPCPCLRMIDHTLLSPTGECAESFMNLVKARKRAGHQLDLVFIEGGFRGDGWYDLQSELRQHVGDLKFRWSWGV